MAKGRRRSRMEILSWLFLVVIVYYSVIKFFIKVIEEKEKRKKDADYTP
jgi:hypothetical protein